ncbi:hypothetical protein GXN76_00775 [Kroppenstedtia pulmonis]|uniref:Tox-ART-HYD1 domain-containing protein n=1 Tax=Kroppenstedtia pulmonis TaxID=1380685 RepID=A0A7D4BFY9_9BACL|nr:HYD1 signature containing ADP-ribosyltransferase family protein [Kroppenstedtia pulmonis]QKG83135.1 hypothetical protein GXN76_00775 [Kroppenstedtia pulmonis]
MGKRETLYHYTNEQGFNGILSLQKLNPSLKEGGRRGDARYGDGVYVTDIKPGEKLEELSRELVNNPRQGHRFTHYIEIDVTNLEIKRGKLENTITNDKSIRNENDILMEVRNERDGISNNLSRTQGIEK